MRDHPGDVGGSLEPLDLVLPILRDQRIDFAASLGSGAPARPIAVFGGKAEASDLRDHSLYPVVVGRGKHRVAAPIAGAPDADPRGIDTGFGSEEGKAVADVGGLVDRIDDLAQHPHRHRSLARLEQPRRVAQRDDPPIRIAPAAIVEGHRHETGGSKLLRIPGKVVLEAAPPVAQQDRRVSPGWRGRRGGEHFGSEARSFAEHLELLASGTLHRHLPHPAPLTRGRSVNLSGELLTSPSCPYNHT